jgi:tRNA isopentenyl-2-thiomethyl-A-37 hydroxylase MiaE
VTLQFIVFEHLVEVRPPVAAGIEQFSHPQMVRVWIARDNIDGEVLIQSRYLEAVLDMVRRHQTEVTVFLRED